MKISIDSEAGMSYIDLYRGFPVHDTIQYPNLNLDLDEFGHVCGVEFFDDTIEIRGVTHERYTQD